MNFFFLWMSGSNICMFLDVSKEKVCSDFGASFPHDFGARSSPGIFTIMILGSKT